MQNLVTKIFRPVLGFLLLTFTLPVAAQNVGINTTTPSSALDVNGQITIDQYNFGGYGGLLIKGGDQGSNYPNIGFSTRYPYNGLNADVISASISGIITNSIPGTESIDLGFATSTAGQIGLTNKMIIKGNGNIGIGTNAPSEKLVIIGKTQTNLLQVTTGAAAGRILTSDASGNATWQLPASSQTNYWDISTNNIYNNNTQNVGIGTNTPTSKLEVNGQLAIDQYNFGGFAGLLIKGNTPGSNYPNIGFSTKRADGTHVISAAISGLITSNTAGTESIDLGFATTTTGQAGLSNKMLIKGNGNIIINPTDDAAGNLLSGGALLFGNAASGEGIASRRTTGAGQWGLDFYTSSKDRLSIQTNGNIVVNPTNDATGGLTSGGALLFGGYSSGEGIASIRTAGSSWQNGLTFYTNYEDRLFIGNNGVSYFYGNVDAYNYYMYSRGYVTTSDAKFKKDIQTITSPLEKIKQLRGVTYNFNNEKYPDMDFGNEKQYGFIAQEVEKVFPEMVKTGEYSKNPKDRNSVTEDYKGVEYQKMIPVLLEAIKEQQKEIELLQTKVASLEKK